MNERGKPKRLGRGLAALMGDLEPMAAPSGQGLRVVPVGALVPSPFQPRREMAEGDLEELAASIRAQGLLQPILVRLETGNTAPERFQIVAGERRWRACQLAGLEEVSVLVRTFDDTQAAAAALIENLQRVDLNAIEEAEGLRRLVGEFDFTQETLSRAIGKSRSHVANMLRLLTLPASVQADVRRGALSAGHARALLALPDPTRAALAVIARGLNVRQTEALAHTTSRGHSGRDPAPHDPDIAALERDLIERLGLAVQVSFDGRGGKVVLRYRSLDQLDGLVRLLAPPS